MTNINCLDGGILQTPLIPFYSGEAELKNKIFLKPENLQAFGSYKIRGVSSVFKNMNENTLKKGICAASAGNMGQSIAFYANKFNIPCQIFVPDTAPEIKKERIKQLGAKLIECSFETIWEFIKGDKRPKTDQLFVHPAFTEELLTGYEQIAYEMHADLPDMDAIVIPFGIGGLSIAISRVLKKLNPHIAIYTCEPETAAPLYQSLMNKKPTAVSPKLSFVDAIGTPEVLPYVFDQLLPVLEGSLVVDLIDIKKSLRELLFNNKLLCEGAAACSLAAATLLAKKSQYRKIGCILTGGNISQNKLTELLGK